MSLIRIDSEPMIRRECGLFTGMSNSDGPRCVELLVMLSGPRPNKDKSNDILQIS